MERARRQASNPLRMILESSRGRRKSVDGDGAEGTEAPRPRSGGTRAAVAAPAGAASVLPPPEPANVMVTLSSAALQGPSLASPVAALPWVPTAGAPPELPSVAGSLPVLVLLAPKLVSVVEPVLSLQLLEDAGRFAELPVDLTIRADGSVALVVVAVSAPRLLVRAVGTALEQWRFEPLPSERVHRVNLVFNAGETR